jgi:hypothetical protein
MPNTWFGIVAPAGTPPAIVAKINAEVNKVLKSEDVTEKFAAEGGGGLGRHVAGIRGAAEDRLREVGQGREGLGREARLMLDA